MKTTKTVDITICDLCNQEQHWLSKCDTCGREICNECMERFSVTVTRNYSTTTPKMKQDDTRSYSTQHLKSDFKANYCAACAKDIMTKLVAAGLKEQPAERGSYAVMD